MARRKSSVASDRLRAMEAAKAEAAASRAEAAAYVAQLDLMEQAADPHPAPTPDTKSWNDASLAAFLESFWRKDNP